MTRYAAAQLLETSQQTLGRIEDGVKAKVPQLWINALADAYEVSDDERRVMIGLAREVASSQKNWWRAYADELRPGFDHYMGLEDAASKVTAWKTAIVPGLLQTPAYRRAMAWLEAPDMSPEQVDKLVEVAAKRQSRLDESGFSLDVVLWEAVLRDQIGGPGVMAEQLEWLAEMSDQPNVSVRMVPFDANGHLGSRVGSFVLLEFPKLPATGLAEPPVVFVEEWAGDLYLERDAEIKRYRNALPEISRVALDSGTTRRIVSKMAKEYRA